MENLWEILIPVADNDGVEFSQEHHTVWQTLVRTIAGGLTMLSPVKGQWQAPDGTVYIETMVPVRVATSRENIVRLSEEAKAHYRQEAVMTYRVSDEVIFT